MLDEAETYLEKDRSDLQGLFNNSLTFDENGEIEGYQDVLQSIVDDYNNNFLTDYNAFLLMFSSLTKDEQEARQAEYDSWQLQKKLLMNYSRLVRTLQLNMKKLLTRFKM